MDTTRRILIPTDGSDGVKPAVRKGIGLARLLGGEVLGLYVIDSAGFATIPGEFQWEALRSAFQDQARAALGFLDATARDAGVTASTRVSEGHPSAEIIRAAAEWPADLIVMGTLGRSGIAHLLLGSVAERVIRHAPCPVMVVRAPR